MGQQTVSANPDMEKARRRVKSLEPQWRFCFPAAVEFDPAAAGRTPPPTPAVETARGAREPYSTVRTSRCDRGRTATGRNKVVWFRHDSAYICRMTMTSATCLALRRLRAANLRPTRQRVALARLLLESGERHVTAEQLHGEALAAGIRVSLATVYNTLHQFTDSGLLHEVVAE